ncbi:hypothetical protein [Streptomyces lydicus]|uniref:hypothetical protein n=1 Tax=Streptomyces lydicus TaxID=47763 RepID=UPI00379CD049
MNAKTLGGLLVDETLRPDIDHHAGVLGQPREVARSVLAIPIAIPPGRAERLRGHGHHRGAKSRAIAASRSTHAS